MDIWTFHMLPTWLHCCPKASKIHQNSTNKLKCCLPFRMPELARMNQVNVWARLDQSTTASWKASARVPWPRVELEVLPAPPVTKQYIETIETISLSACEMFEISKRVALVKKAPYWSSICILRIQWSHLDFTTQEGTVPNHLKDRKMPWVSLEVFQRICSPLRLLSLASLAIQDAPTVMWFNFNIEVRHEDAPSATVACIL